MEYFIVSINVLIPIIVLIAVGYVLKKLNIADEHFVKKSSDIVFKLALPVALFYSTVNSDVDFNISKDTWIFIITVCIFYLSAYFIGLLIANKSNWDNKTKGAFIQGVYRSNYIVIGYPILLSFFGDSVVLRMSLLAVFTIPISNILAVLTFTIFDPDKKGINVKEIIVAIIKNPLIIGIVSGFIFKYFNIYIPTFVNDSLGMIKGIAIPLALINIGTLFSLNIDLKQRRPLIISVFLRTVFIPLLFTSLAVLLGYRDYSLVIIFALFATPSATTSSIMAKAMNSNDSLAASIIVASTSVSFVTIFAGIMIMKYYSLF